MSVELVASCWSGRCWLPRRHLPAALFLLPFANFPKDLSIPSSPSLQIIPLIRVYEFSLPTPITILFSLSLVLFSHGIEMSFQEGMGEKKVGWKSTSTRVEDDHACNDRP